MKDETFLGICLAINLSIMSYLLYINFAKAVAKAIASGYKKLTRKIQNFLKLIIKKIKRLKKIKLTPGIHQDENGKYYIVNSKKKIQVLEIENVAEVTMLLQSRKFTFFDSYIPSKTGKYLYVTKGGQIFALDTKNDFKHGTSPTEAASRKHAA